MAYTAIATVTSKKPYADANLMEESTASASVTKTGTMHSSHCTCKVSTHKSHALDLISATETHSTFFAEQSLNWSLGKYCYG